MKHFYFAALLSISMLAIGCQPKQPPEQGTAGNETVSSEVVNNEIAADEIPGAFAHERDEGRANSSTGKPSAPISFSSDYDGSSEAGQAETFTIRVSAEIPGILELRISSPQNVLEGGEHQSRHNVEAGQSVAIPVTITLPSSNKHYLNIHARITRDGLEQSGAFALALNPASEPNPQANSLVPRPMEPEKADGDDDAVILLPAEETTR